MDRQWVVSHPVRCLSSLPFCHREHMIQSFPLFFPSFFRVGAPAHPSWSLLSLLFLVEEFCSAVPSCVVYRLCLSPCLVIRPRAILSLL